MSAATANDVSSHMTLVYAKAKTLPAYGAESLAQSMHWAAYELWGAEYTTWSALVSLFGPDNSAVKCAWRRRTAYSIAVSVLQYPAFH
jgi:hypothetical protein